MPRRASGPGSGAESPSSRESGRGRKGGRPLARHATHVRGEPGAKPFVDDLLLGRGFVRSRAAPSLRSIESQPSTQGFVRHSGQEKGSGRARAARAGLCPSVRPSGFFPVASRRPGPRAPPPGRPRPPSPAPRDGAVGGSRARVPPRSLGRPAGWGGEGVCVPPFGEAGSWCCLEGWGQSVGSPRREGGRTPRRVGALSGGLRPAGPPPRRGLRAPGWDGEGGAHRVVAVPSARGRRWGGGRVAPFPRGGCARPGGGRPVRPGPALPRRRGPGKGGPAGSGWPSLRPPRSFLRGTGSTSSPLTLARAPARAQVQSF